MAMVAKWLGMVVNGQSVFCCNNLENAQKLCKISPF